MSTQIDIQKPVVDAGRWRVLAPFRSREYSLLMAAVSLSIFADGMFAVVLALQVIELDNNPVSLSIVTTCWGAAFVAFVLVGGITADRIKQRTIIIATESVNVIASSAIAVLGLVGALEVWHLAVASAAMGAAAAFFFPAYSAILPRILPADQLLAANGVEGVVRPVFQRAVGPAIAGIVVGATFPAMGATTVAVLFAVGLVLLVATRPAMKTPVGEPDQERPRVLRDLRDGFVFMLRTPWLLWTLLFASMFVLVVLGPIEVLLPFIAKDRFADGAKSYGFILAFFGMGSALGALAVSSRRLPRRYLSVMMAMWSLGSIPLVVVGFTSSFPSDGRCDVHHRRHRRRGHGHLGHAAAAAGTDGDAWPGVEPGLLCLPGVHAGVVRDRRPAVEGRLDGDDLPGGRPRPGGVRGRRDARGADAPGRSWPIRCARRRTPAGVRAP